VEVAPLRRHRDTRREAIGFLLETATVAPLLCATRPLAPHQYPLTTTAASATAPEEAIRVR
jgi:hypothetical protein